MNIEDEIKKAKERLKTLKTVKEELPCVILVDGKQVRLKSGKSAWKNAGAARIALSHALPVPWRSVKEIREKLEEEGFVKIKSFDISDSEPVMKPTEWLESVGERLVHYGFTSQSSRQVINEIDVLECMKSYEEGISPDDYVTENYFE